MDTRVQAYLHDDRLYFAAPEASAKLLSLEVATGIRVERAPHGRLLLTNGRNAWVGVLTLALRLGWCQIGDGETEGTEPGANGLSF